MKKHLSTVILIAVFLVGLSVLLYPAVSNSWNVFRQSRAIAVYEKNLGDLAKADDTAYFESAQRYNEMLRSLPQAFISGAPSGEEYKALLNVTSDGQMGYITIKKLGVRLPLYHGTSDSVLAAGAGHLEGSSLPIGGPGTHAVITGHSGLPSAKLLTDLHKLEIGDTFTVTVLNQTLTYEVDNISTVEPDDNALLSIVPEENYLTLLTCTPYGINSHRLLVRGSVTDAAGTAAGNAGAVRFDPIAAAPILAAPMLLVLLILLLARKSTRRKNKPHDTEKAGISIDDQE